MITAAGKDHIRRFLAGYETAIAKSISVGIGNAAENAADICLQLEVSNTVVNSVTYDFANNKLLFKGSLEDDTQANIYEIGLYSLQSNPAAAGYGSRIITTFDSVTESWMNTATGNPSNFDSTVTRIGIDSLVQTPSASNTEVSNLANLTLDLSGNSGNDTFTFAYNVNNSNTNNITIKFITDSSNYYYYSLGAQTTGYKFVSVTKGSASVTGSPNWAAINQIQVETNSKASGASSVEFEAIRIEDRDSQNLDFVLVARKVLTTPITKLAGQALDVEYSMDVLL